MDAKSNLCPNPVQCLSNLMNNTECPKSVEVLSNSEALGQRLDRNPTFDQILSNKRKKETSNFSIGLSLDKCWMWTIYGQSSDFLSLEEFLLKAWTNSGHYLDFITCGPWPSAHPWPTPGPHKAHPSIIHCPPINHFIAHQWLIHFIRF